MSLELLVVLALILANGFFALSEMAVMTSRKSRLRQQAKDSARARAALELAEHPERFLSSVQVWITLLGILTGFFGGEALASSLEGWLRQFAPLARYAHGISIALSLGLITIFSVVLGELVPKRLGILAPERLATLVAAPMRVLTIVAMPAVLLLAWLTRLLLRVMGVKQSNEQAVTEEEIKLLVAEGAEQGVIDADERNLVNRALSFGDRTVSGLMTPRGEIEWLDTTLPLEQNLQRIRATPFTRYPVRRGSDADVAGVLHVRSLSNALMGGKVEPFKDLAPALFVPETARALGALEKLRDSEAGLALAVDEYGEITGLVTLNDLLKSVFGRFAQASEDGEPHVVQRSDGSWLVDGRLAIDDLKDLLGVAQLAGEGDEDFRTAAGMMTARFGRIPQVGEHFTHAGYRFEVVDLDGARIDKLLVARVMPPEPDNLV